MKKRLLSLLLAAVLALGMFPAAQAATITADIDAGYNTATGVPSDSALFTTAYVRNKDAASGGNGTAQQLEVVINLKAFNSRNSLFAVVMLASEYGTVLSGGPGAAGLDSTKYYQLTADNTYYAMGRGSAEGTSDGQRLALPLVAPSAEHDNALGSGASVPNKSMPKAKVTEYYYYEEYVLVVFGGDKAGTESNYYVDHFYMDADGYVRTPSYLIRYNANNPATGSGSVAGMPNPAYTAKRAVWADGALGTGTPGNATLSATKPTRTGYDFVGWTTTKMEPLEADGAKPTTGFYEAGAAYLEPAALDKTYNLYALWRVVPVKFDTDKTIISYTGEDVPQVGVPFNSGDTPFLAKVPEGTKTYKVETWLDGVKEDTPNLYGLKVETVPNTKNTQWRITGTPTSHSDGKKVRFDITVQDASNTTTDTITINFDQIQKGAQPSPTLDDNTGLDTRLTPGSEDAPDDGQIFGFYSGGPTHQTDDNATGYLPGEVDGTGTMTDYYLTLGMVYEYRPVTVGGTAVSYDEGGYAAMPGGGWREVPFPESWYTSEELEQLLPTLAKNAKAVVRSDRDGTTGAAHLTSVDVSALTDFGETGWLDGYGSISYENGLPVIHGLNEGDTYEVRFRANANYAASAVRNVTIGGAAGGGSVSTDGVKTVVLFDWDNTYLGSLAVPTGSTAEEVKNYIAAYIASQPVVQAALAGKPGYDFTHWASYNADASTAWGKKAITSPTAAGTLLDVERPPEAKFEGIIENMTVKAAYQINDEHVESELSGLANRQYTFSNEVSYLKMGTGNDYSITVTVNRINASKQGVQRLIKPALRIAMTSVDDAVSYQLVYLGTGDTESATFAVNGARMKSFSCTVIDVDNVSNWVSSAAARSATFRIEAGTPASKGFVYYGSLALVNEQLKEGGTIGWITLSVLQDNLGLNTGSLKIADARTRLKDAYLSKGDALTFEEMQKALNV